MKQPTIDMLVSPYDRGAAPSPDPAPALIQLAYTRAPKERWVPSRFNARTVGEDGRLILWNTYTGAITAFQEKDREAVVATLTTKGGLSAPLGKHAEYLSRRGYLVREGTDEMLQFRYMQAKQQWRTDILQFIALASEDCNFRCVYCYEKFKQGTMRPEVRDGIKNVVRKRARYLTELGLTWFGGEPLYGWEAIEDLGPFFKATAQENDIRFWSNMTTNAYLLTEEKATRLLDWGCRQFQITIDGLPEEHDCKRVGRDGSPTFHTILDNLRSMAARRDEPFQVNLRVNYDQKNVMKLGPFLEALSEDFGGDRRFRMRFYAVGKWGGAKDDELEVCGTSEQRDAMKSLRRQAETWDLAVEGGIQEYAAPGGQVCYAARPFNFIVGASGKLMKCTIALDDLEANVVGQLHPDGTMEMNEDRLSRWVAPYYETDNLCQTCYVLPGCQGAACPLTRITRDERTCCGVKSELKREMRFTLEHSSSGRKQVVAENGEAAAPTQDDAAAAVEALLAGAGAAEMPAGTPQLPAEASAS